MTESDGAVTNRFFFINTALILCRLRARCDSTCNAVSTHSPSLTVLSRSCLITRPRALGIIRERSEMWKRCRERNHSGVPQDEKSCHDVWTVTPWPLSLQELVKVLRRFLDRTPPTQRQRSLHRGDASTAIASIHWNRRQTQKRKGDCSRQNLTAVLDKEHL